MCQHLSPTVHHPQPGRGQPPPPRPQPAAHLPAPPSGPPPPARTAPGGPSSPRRDTSASTPRPFPPAVGAPEVRACSHATCGPQRGGLCVRPDRPVEERALSRAPRRPQRQSQKPAGRAGAPVRACPGPSPASWCPDRADKQDGRGRGCRWSGDQTTEGVRGVCAPDKPRQPSPERSALEGAGGGLNTSGPDGWRPEVWRACTCPRPCRSQAGPRLGSS